MKDQLYQILSISAIVALFVPFTIILLRKLWKEEALLLFASYWGLCGIVNIIDILPFMNRRQLEVTGVIYNIIDGPFAFIIIYFTTFSSSIKRFIGIITPIFVLSELVSLLINGVRYEALTWVLGVSVLLGLIVVTWSIIWYVNKIEYSYHEKSMLFIYAALLFSNGTFMVIYVFDYFVDKTSSKDNFLIYYISCIVAISIASCGYMLKHSHRAEQEGSLQSPSLRSPHYRY